LPKLNHATAVLGFTGETLPYRDSPDSEERPLTFRDLAAMTLGHVDPQEPLGAEMKSRIFGLTMKFYGRNGKVDLTVEEAALIKERAGKALSSPLAYGRMCEWLEGNEQTVPETGDHSE
jgi:hypothetical protein